VKKYKCSKCNELKPESEFHKRARGGRDRQYICKQCIRDYGKEYYQKNRDRYLANAARTRPIRVEAIRRFIYEYLCSHPCVDCGESDPVVLVFDHVSDKDYEIARMITDGFALERIRTEISKCKVRCSNCHIRRHAVERDIWTVKFQNEDCKQTHL